MLVKMEPQSSINIETKVYLSLNLYYANFLHKKFNYCNYVSVHLQIQSTDIAQIHFTQTNIAMN